MAYIDLTSVLDDWDYDPDRIAVRKILGADNTQKIQLRVELGLLQMEVTGRPDARKPFGCESLLEFHTQRLAEHEERNGTPLGFALSVSECNALSDEVSLYYRRCVSLFVLEEYDKVYEDTSHNLAIMDLCREFALNKEDRTRLENFRPYVLMMDARSRAYQSLAQGDPACALAHINRGLLHIRTMFDGPDAEEAFQSLEEVSILQEVRQELIGNVPQDPVVEAKRALKSAIDREEFEEAARLRDELEELGKKTSETSKTLP